MSCFTSIAAFELQGGLLPTQLLDVGTLSGELEAAQAVKLTASHHMNQPATCSTNSTPISRMMISSLRRGLTALDTLQCN